MKNWIIPFLLWCNFSCNILGWSYTNLCWPLVFLKLWIGQTFCNLTSILNDVKYCSELFYSSFDVVVTSFNRRTAITYCIPTSSSLPLIVAHQPVLFLYHLLQLLYFRLSSASYSSNFVKITGIVFELIILYL